MHMIRKDSKFLSRSTILIKKEVEFDEQNRSFIIFNPSEFPWKKVDIEFEGWTEQEFSSAVLPLLHSAEALILSTTSPLDNARKLVGVINAASKIKELTMVLNVLENSSPKYVRKHVDQLVKILLLFHHFYIFVFRF